MSIYKPQFNLNELIRVVFCQIFNSPFVKD